MTRCVVIVVIVDVTRAASLRMRWRARRCVAFECISFALFQLRDDVSVKRALTMQTLASTSTRGAIGRPRGDDGRRRVRRGRAMRRRDAIGATKDEESSSSSTSDAIEKVFSKLYKENSTGKSIYYGVFQRDVDETERVDDVTAAALRAEATRTLTNIGSKERERRMSVGLVSGALTAAIVATQLLTHAPRIERLAVVVPLFFALGFVGSAKSGL